MCKRIFLAAIPLLAIGGCKVGPDYHAPALPMPQGYHAATQPASTQPVEAVDLKRWWESFHDPMLNELIERGVNSSLDIQLAAARIREARAELQSERANLFPTVDADGSYARTRSSQSVIAFGPSEGSLYDAGFDAGWQIDVFGGTRRAIEAARDTLQSQIDARRTVTITLLSEVAQNYIMVRGFQRELAIVRDNVAAQQDNLDVTRAKLQAGNATELNIQQAQAQLTTTQSEIPTLQTEIQQAIYRLSQLLDVDPGTLYPQLAADAPLPFGPPAIPPGLPSELLRRRPDVRQAERLLAAATANIGVATADLFPKFSLTGSLGVESLSLKTLADASSPFWSVGPTVSWRIFDAGQIKANIRAADARQQEAIIQYRQAVRQAITDVEAALVAYAREQDRRELLRQAVDANRQAVDLSVQLNNAGLVDFLNVLTARQTLFDSQDQLAQSDRAISIDLIAVYNALGGGWESFEPQPAPAPPTTTLATIPAATAPSR